MSTVEEQQEHIRALLNQLVSHGVQARTLNAPEAEVQPVASVTPPQQHLTDADVVERADSELDLLERLLQEQREELTALFDERGHLAQTLEDQQKQAEAWRTRLATLSIERATAEASLHLVAGTDGEAVAQVHLDEVAHEQETLTAALRDYQQKTPEREAEQSAQLDQLQSRIHETHAAIASITERRDALSRARQEAFARAGNEAARELVQDITSRQASIKRIRQRLADEETALSEVRQSIRHELARWPSVADRIEKRYGEDPSATSPEAELLRRWLAYTEYLQVHGKGIAEYSLTSHTSLVGLLELPTNTLKLSLQNMSGASAGTLLSNKVDAVRTILKGLGYRGGLDGED